MNAFCTALIIFLLVLTMLFINKPHFLFDNDGNPKAFGFDNVITIGTLLYTAMVCVFLLLTYMEYAINKH